MAVVTFVGAGVIGVSWARLFGEAGWDVHVSDPRPDLDEFVRSSLGLRWSTIGLFQSNVLGCGPGGIRHLLSHIGSQLTFEIGAPDPAKMPEFIDAVEKAYGVRDEAYEELVDLRDRRTRAVLGPLDWPEPPKPPTPPQGRG